MEKWIRSDMEKNIIEHELCINHEPPEIKLYQKTYREYIKELAHESNKRYREKHPDEYRKSMKKYWQSEKGKIQKSKQHHKRKTKYGFNPIFENILDEPFALHHIDDVNILAIPKDMHEQVLKKPVWKHREILLPIVEQLYPGIKLFGYKL